MSSAPDELANRLDEVLPPHRSDILEPSDADPVIQAAVRLARGPHPVLSADAVAQIQARMLARVPRQRKPFQRQMVLRWAAAACLIMVILVSGTATVSAQSLPGDTLYPVKRLVERGRLALTGDEGEVELRLKYAERRLDEFAELQADRGEINADVLDDASDEMNTAFGLMEKGVGLERGYQDKLVALSERQAELAQDALETADPDEAEELQQVVSEADNLKEKVRSLNRSAKPMREIPAGMYTRHILEGAATPNKPDTVVVFDDTPTMMAATSAAPVFVPTRKPAEHPVVVINPPTPTDEDETRDQAGDDDPPVVETPGPTDVPVTPVPTDVPTVVPTDVPVTPEPTIEPTVVPTDEPVTPEPTIEPTIPPAITEPPMVEEPEETRDQAGDGEPPVVEEPEIIPTPEPTEPPVIEEVVEEAVVTAEP